MNIWLLEDDQAQATLLTGWLSSNGHEVRHFPRGLDLIDAIPEGGYELFILDLSLIHI